MMSRSPAPRAPYIATALLQLLFDFHPALHIILHLLYRHSSPNCSRRREVLTDGRYGYKMNAWPRHSGVAMPWFVRHNQPMVQ